MATSASMLQWISWDITASATMLALLSSQATITALPRPIPITILKESQGTSFRISFVSASSQTQEAHLWLVLLTPLFQSVCLTMLITLAICCSKLGQADFNLSWLQTLTQVEITRAKWLASVCKWASAQFRAGSPPQNSKREDAAIVDPLLRGAHLSKSDKTKETNKNIIFLNIF